MWKARSSATLEEPPRVQVRLRILCACIGSPLAWAYHHSLRPHWLHRSAPVQPASLVFYSVQSRSVLFNLFSCASWWFVFRLTDVPHIPFLGQEAAKTRPRHAPGLGEHYASSPMHHSYAISAPPRIRRSGHKFISPDVRSNNLRHRANSRSSAYLKSSPAMTSWTQSIVT